MSDLSDRLRITKALDHGEEPPAALFYERVLRGGLPELRTDAWPTSERTLDAVGEPLLRARGEGSDSLVCESGGTLVLVGLHSGYVSARIAAADDATALRELERLRGLLPTPEPIARHDVPVAFWTYSPQGPIPSLRPIHVPEWDDIRENYAASTRRGLDAVMHDFRPAHGGQLILWHGAAGTGKTYALRALAWEWREWCQLHYVVDPDTFFGERADYLMGVLMQPTGMTMGIHEMSLGGWSSYGSRAIFHELDDTFGEIDVEGDGPSGDPAQHWRLLLLEDTGELLTPDAKSIIGQGLSRFLNVVDGLIGQGLRVLVLVTTNEEIRTLHPAVARPGRCAANVSFEPLGVDEARDWLAARGADRDAAPGSQILASLYAQVEGFDQGEAKASVGFGG